MNAYDRMQNAVDDYAMQNGDGFSDRDYIGANDYRDEGYKLAEQSMTLPADERRDYIDAEAYTYPVSAQYLVSCAADYRLSELEADKPAPRTDWFAVASDILGGQK